MTKAVLFVDDDEDLREVMHDMLERLGVRRVVTAASLRDLECRRDEALGCELAILDINLGKDQPDGVAIYGWLERQGFVGRIVFLTGHAGNDSRVRAAARLADSHVATKPLSINALREILDLSVDAR